MEQANVSLEQTIATHGQQAVDIEFVGEREREYIEMDLGCGVLEVRHEDEPSEVEKRTEEFLMGGGRERERENGNKPLIVDMGMAEEENNDMDDF